MTLTDASGTILAGRSITWSSSDNAVVTVNATGLAHAVSSGSATIVATAEGKSGYGSLSVPAVPVSPYPHQPPGYSVIAENSFSQPMGYPASATGISGLWWQLVNGSSNISIVSVPDAPQSGPWVIQTKFPAGWGAGNAPGVYGGWDGGEGGTQLSKMYVSMWIKILGADYENQLVGTKIAYMGFARDASSALNDGYFWIPGDGVQAVHSSFNLEYREQNNVGRNLAQNVDGAKVLTVGSWHHFELTMQLNTLGSANGTLKWWVDDRLILDYADMVYIVPGASSGFQGFKVDPVWGGLGGARTRDDYMQVDHILVSGVQ